MSYHRHTNGLTEDLAVILFPNTDKDVKGGFDYGVVVILEASSAIDPIEAVE